MEKKLYPLTNPQKSIYYTEEYSNHSNLNNISGNIIIKETVNFPCLEKALNMYVKKNDAIRIRIVISNGIPKQYIHNYEPFSIQLVELENEKDLKKLNKTLVERTFDFIDSNLFSFTLFKFPDSTGGLNVTFHHIISDAWTMSLFIDEVMKLYNSLINNEEVDSALNPSYLDYISSEDEYISSNKFEKDKEFWNNVFATSPELAKITNHVSSSSSEAIRETFHLEKSVYEQIDNFCKNHRCSIYTFFMCIFSIYLSKINNIEAPIIGTPVLNRTNFKEKNTAGMYISTIPFKSVVKPDITFDDFLTNVNLMQMSTYRHQKYPYTLLLEELKEKYNYTQNLYDVVLSYQNARDDSKSSKVSYKSEWLFTGQTVDTLEIHFYDMDNTGDFDIFYDYQISQLTKDDVHQIHERILSIVSQVIMSSNILLKDIKIVTNNEEIQIKQNFNNSLIDYDKNKSIVEVFENQAEKNADDIALVFEDKTLTYKELNEKVNQFAHFLKSQNIKPNDKIAIFLPRCIDLILSMLAIKKVGCAYLLIESSLPIDRIKYMLENANASLIITNKELSNKDFSNCVILDDISFENLPISNLDMPYFPEDSLSIVYTSGSTGIPKGILLKNFSLLNLVLGYCHSMNANNFSNFISTCSVSFDMFAAEIWIPLLLGKKLVLANDEESKNPILLSSLIEKEDIEFMLITSSKINLLLSNSDISKCLQHLKAIQLGGEVLSPEFYNRLIHYTNAKIYNGYGPSETTSCATCKFVNSADNITIGKPLPNVQVYICNNLLNLCPPNIIGELCIAGDGVSYGYINQPDLTKKSFIPNSFGSGLLYKTGDLAKFLPNGEIAYIGRNDSQVKIRGLRIELEEINKVILSFPNIDNCITVVKKVNGIDSICCYIVSTSININALKEYASKKLPYYMVPSHFVQLDKLPITLNGKIDLKALPEITVKYKYIAPKTQIEKTIATLWENLLNLKQISVSSNFFELGGDSLNAIKFIAELENELGIRLQIKDIFTFPTIRSLSNYIDKMPLGQRNNEQIVKVPNQTSYITSSAQKRIYFTVEKEGSKSITYNTPGGLIFEKIPDIEKLQDSFTKLVETNESLRTYFVLENDELRQKIIPPFDYKLEVVHYNSTNIDKLFDEFIKPFDLSIAPLFRAKLVILNNKKAILLLDMHHIICDGESIQIFLKKLSAYYEGKIVDTNLIDYKDYACWENKKINSKEYKKIEEYWLKKFEGEIPTLNMPTNFTRPAILSFEGNKISMNMDKSDKIYTLCNELHITPYQFFLGIYYILLYKYTGQEDIIVGTPVVGRDLKELHSIIGMFVNTLALREKIIPQETVFDFMHRVSQNLLEDFENDSFPFDELIKKLNFEKDVSRNPLFDTMFVYQNEGMKKVKLGNLNAKYYLPKSSISKFDFTLEILPDGNHFLCNLEYNTNLYTSTFMQALLEHYLELISKVTENPHLFVSEVSMLSPKEANQILKDFNSNSSCLFENEQVVSLFEKQVENNKDKTALIFENKSLSYDEINKKANQLANLLISKKIARNSIIGVLLPRSPELIISMLGILKSGSAYMLIDSTLPYDRILYMLENSNASLLLTNHNMKNIDFPKQCFIDDENLNLYRNDNPCLYSEDEDLFSVIYTSGSTGMPKGVLLKRKGVMNLLLNHHLKMNINECNNFISISTISFDMFMVETFMPLLSGKTLILTNDEEQKIPVTMADIINKYNIDFILTTPSRIELLLDSNIQNCLNHLKVIQLGGEVFTPELYSRLSKVTSANIYNAYGPTEVTACCSCSKITDSRNITIGKPFDNAPIYICDKDMLLCPIGVPGEICVGGKGIAKGYLGNPELTKKSFVSNPFGKGIIYKTGDIGYYTYDGNIVYIGRRDFQIKIRGLRVELSEIENKILEIPNIKNCAVIYKKEQNTSYLACFYTVNSSIDASTIRTELKKSLPLYMVPKYIICLDTLPITTNGKVNKKLLEEYSIEKGENKNYVAPQTEIEKLLCHIWEQLLNTTVGIDDDVFELGADSLLAIKFKTELLAYKINIPYSDLFKYLTVRELCKMHGDSYSDDTTIYGDEIKQISSIVEKNCIQNIKQSFIVNNDTNNVLLLGGNGFVGIHILYELIKQDNGNIYCIIRDKNNKTAYERLTNVLHFYFGNELDEFINKRIFVISANVTEENFGLSAKKFEELTNNISIVIDSAAMVKHYGNSKKFKHINVDLTRELVNYCIKYKKRLLYISTTSVAGNNADSSQNVFSESCFYIGQQLNNTYIKSKFDAEKLVLSGISNGLEAQILRLGNITSRYKDGKFQINAEENAFLNRLKSFVQIGLIPKNLERMNLEFTPVDSCANAIVKIMQNYNKKLSIFHLYNDYYIKMKEFINFANKNGISLKFVEDNDFNKKINNMLKDSKEKEKLSGIVTDLDYINKMSDNDTTITTCEFTKMFLHQINFNWPIIDNNYLKKYLSNL